MQSPNQSAPGNGASALLFHAKRHWRAAPEPGRSANMRALSLISLFVCLLLASCEHQSSSKPSVLQMRLVQDRAASDTEQMTILHSLTDATSKAPETLNVQRKVLLDSSSVASASVQAQSASTAPAVIQIVFTEKGRKLFTEVTRQNVGKRLAIIGAGKLLAAPRIEMEVISDRALVSGRFSVEEANELAAKINHGASK